jgi:membrane fusion protein (multidrug efflux system)
MIRKMQACVLLLGVALTRGEVGRFALAEETVPPESSPIVSVATAEVQREQVTETVTAFGMVTPDPNSQFVVATPIEGRIKELNAYKGQVVQAGDKVAQIEPGPVARSQFGQLQAAVTNAEQQLEHVRRLFDEQLATRDQVAGAEQALADARSKLEAQKALGGGEQLVTLRSPKTGIVTNLSAQIGAQVTANATVAEFADRASLIIQLGVEASDAPDVTAGDKVRLEHLFAKGPTVPAEIASVGAIVDPTTRLLGALVHVTGEAAEKFALGETVKATVATKQSEVLTIPRSALLYDGAQPYVFLIEAGHAHRRPVKLGEGNGERAWIESGLEVGQLVAVSGLIGLTDGAAVRERGL